MLTLNRASSKGAKSTALQDGEESSRLIVKNIPKHVSDARLREHFQQNGGHVTDVKIILKAYATQCNCQKDSTEGHTDRHKICRNFVSLFWVPDAPNRRYFNTNILSDLFSDGNSRQFAFIGFATPAEAKSALKFFDKTFLDTSRIFVKFALPKGDTRIDRPWSKHSEGSSRFEQAKKAKEENSSDSKKKRPSSEITKGPDDAKLADMSDAKKRKLEEFLGVTKKGKLWANDDGFGFEGEKDEKAKKKNQKGDAKSSHQKGDSTKGAKSKDNKEDTKAKDVRAILKEQDSDEDDSDDDEYQDFSKLKSQKKSSSKDSEEEISDDDEEMSIDGDDGDESEENEGPKSKQKMQIDEPADSSRGSNGTKNEEEDSENKNGKKTSSKSAPERKQYPKLEASKVSETGRLFVRNLAFTTTEEEVKTLFSKFGNVSEVHLSIDKLTKRSKGFGFVSFLFPAHAIEAANQLDGKFFQGRILHVLPAMEQQEEAAGEEKSESTESGKNAKSSRTPGPQMGSSTGFVSEYQKKKAEKQKELANQDYNWNSLFIRPDAVASAMASNLQVSKSDLLDPESSSSMAVRLALGETNLIKETKEFLAAEGVSLDALKGHYNKAIVRSSTIMLVKNIPTHTQLEELKNVFGRFGSLVKVVMPPSRTVSIVEFEAAAEARAAFKHLAYKQFKDAPLFLEWAPIGVLGAESKQDEDSGDASNKKKHGAEKSDQVKEIKETISKTTSGPESVRGTSSDVQKGDSTLIQSEDSTKEGGKKDKKSKSKTDAQEDSEDASSAALSKMGSIESVVEDASLTLFVKNLSFATTEDSLRTLVERLLGSVNNVSIAMHKVKDEMMSQGFGFIECKTREQAVKAWKQLQGSMLDGHQLQVSFSSQRKAGASVSLNELAKMASKRKEGPKTQVSGVSTKIMVKNVPFEATRNEIRDLFAPFGELTSVRLPNKPGGKGHRGFAFVEYVTPDEAAAAIEALGTTHLYNRRLVIDYAEQDGDIEAIRAKTAAQFEN